MAGVWQGFTEEDIGFYQKNNEDANERIVSKKEATNLQGLGKRNVARERILIQGKESRNPKTENQIPEGAKLSQDKEKVPLIQPEGDKKGSKEKEEKTKAEKTKEDEQNMEDDVVEAGPTIMGSNPVCLKVIEGKAYELLDKNPADVSKATLEVFEARQKKLEEQNKRRKEMLAKVINARKKQTTEEAKRLQHIQEELQKLDMLLSNDVGILRNKIEEASLDFVEAQKRYNKAEKEFLDAKQNLFAKLEKKELLTKLLCTIIEQNEVRKAQKLSELMEKLKINENGIEGSPAFPYSVINPANDCQRALNESTTNTKTKEGDKPKPSS